MKYENVIARSASAANAAASHQPPSGAGARHAATRLARVSSVSGTVVTKTQNRRPVSSRRAASAFQLVPEPGVDVIQFGTTIRCSYNPAPNATPRLMTNSHKRIAGVGPDIWSPSSGAKHVRCATGRLSANCGVLLDRAHAHDALPCLNVPREVREDVSHERSSAF